MSDLLVAGILVGLDHVETHSGTQESLGRLDTLAQGLAPDGRLLDGWWWRGRVDAVALALTLAQRGAAVAVVDGVVEVPDGVPQGWGARVAQRLVGRARPREIFLLSRVLQSVSLPPGVGVFEPPEPLAAGLPPFIVLRDYRGDS